MRIALFVPRFPVASETFVLDQIAGLLERGHDVEIFASPPRERSDRGTGSATSVESARREALEADDLAGRIRYWPDLPSSWILRAVRAARRIARATDDRRPLLRSLDVGRFGTEALSLSLLHRAVVAASADPFDAILAHFGPAAVLAQRLRHVGALHGRLVAVFHGYDMSAVLKERGPNPYAELLSEIDLCLPVSDHWRRLLLGLGAPADRVVVHHMGVDCDALTYVPPRAGADGPVRLLSVGRLVEKKGFEYGVRAVANLVREGRPVSYTILGEGPSRPELEALVDELEPADRIELPGWRSREEVAAALGRADILLAPSVTAADGDMEGIPVTVMEAMARGLPVVSTHHSGIPELVRDGETGYLVPERDPDSLADRVAELIADPGRRGEMGRAGRRVVEEDFDIDELNDRLERLLTDLSGRGEPG